MEQNPFFLSNWTKIGHVTSMGHAKSPEEYLITDYG